MNWKLWLKGLFSAAIGGGATAVSTMIVAPETFNLQEGLQKLITVTIVSAIVAAANYLKQSPLPINDALNGKINLKSILVFFLIPIFGLGLLSCASMQTIIPPTTDGKILYSKATLTGLNNGMAELVKTGQIDIELAKKYESKALEAKVLIGIAEKALTEGKEDDALSTWRAVNIILIELNNYLLTKGGKE